MRRQTKQTKEKGFYLPVIIIFGIALLPLLTIKEGEGEITDSKSQESALEPQPSKPSGKERTKKKKKAGYCIYLIIALCFCLLPLLTMGIQGTIGTTENRAFTALPQPFYETGLNWDYPQELGAYFDDHFAFRSELVALDAWVRTSFLEVSPVSDVIVGENGWLYYAATLDDFQHKYPVSDRMLFNIAHNVSLMQDYTESLGMEFLFTVAPNKNSLYGENMPRRLCYQVEAQSDMERLLPWLEQEQVHYVDLYSLFGGQDEILYYQRDSHWNGKGAVMVYNALLDSCGKEHETYENSQTQITNDYYGDLSKMLFPTGAEPEADIHYTGGNPWTYSQGESVEDNFIITECTEGSQTLLMYRDSFGNSLLPLMAGEFSQAVFSKRVPYSMTDLAIYWPDIVIVEKVERHLPTLGEVPPVMNAQEAVLDNTRVPVESNTTIHLSKEGSYWKLSGVADMKYMSTDSRIYVEITDADDTKLYEAFCTSFTEDDLSSDYGYTAYISEILLAGEQLHVSVITEKDGEAVILKETEINLTEK